MVFFTCSHCGESLKKNKVEKHYHTVCRGNAIAVTCVDCCIDFSEETFTAHTKCITEEERYAAKGFIPKPSANKGERKQQRWQDIIRAVKNDRKDLSQNEQQILSLLVNQENVPRKRNKFQNYLKTNLHGRYKEDVANHIFDMLEEQSKLEEASDKKTDDIQHNEEEEAEEKENKSLCEQPPNEQLSKKERKALKKKAKYEAQLKEIEIVEENDDEAEATKKSKKCKKNKEAPVENGVVNKKRKNDMTVEEDGHPVEKKSKDTENHAPKQKFNWEKVIISVLEEKELSLKRLKKKVFAELEACGETVTEKHLAKFNKKINTIPAIVLMKDKVRLKCDSA